ncbi:MAG TPA: SRPBCC family protein [Mycobacteriales bacterium]|nr:SRPBCC family protein [Mycobacteriales bacterium]
MTKDVVTVERVIPAPASEVFALLADAHRHAEIDGSGNVVETRGAAPERLVLGSEFGMSMKYFVPYAMKSRVIEYDENRRIAWQTVPVTPGSGLIAGGRIWRYELEPVEGGTLVRETWDISKERMLTKPLVARMRDKTRANITRSLERLEQVLA